MGLQYLFDYLKDQPDMYLQEMQEMLSDEFEEEVSLMTIWRTLKRHNWNCKFCKKRAVEQS